MPVCVPAIRPLTACFVLSALLIGWGCGQKLVLPRLEFKSDEPQTPTIPLTVRLDIPDALQQAQLFYKDSCGASQSISLGERLAEQVKADAAGVFEKIIVGESQDPADAVLSAAIETSEITLHIPRREVGEYKMTALVRVRITMTDAEGKPLFNEAIKGEGKWVVSTDGTDCVVRGLMLPVTEAMEKISDRTVEALSQGVKVREWAIRMQARKEMAAGGRSSGGALVPQTGGGDPPTISFRASLEDANRNQTLDVGEKVIVRVEVANSGPGVARGVAVLLSGTPALVNEFTNPTLMGDLQPGEKKQVAITTILSASLAEQQAEVLVQITEAGGFGPPTRKRFVALVKPNEGTSETVEVLSIDVDKIPARVQGFERRTSYAVVVGIGGYRDDGVPKLKYAKRDAEVVAQHLTALAGYAPDNVRVLTDDRALLVDLQETFEEWLPRVATSSGTVLVYLVGNAALNQESGEVILVPYEGRQDMARRGYSLKRLQDVLSRLPSRLNLVFADLSFQTDRAGAGSRAIPWSAGLPGGKSRTVLMGSSSVNAPSLSFDAGQHGLFTYHFLKALRGQADVNGNGWVEMGEMIAYLREQVPKGAAAFNNEQTPVVTPVVDPAGPIGTYPISKATRRG